MRSVRMGISSFLSAFAFVAFVWHFWHSTHAGSKSVPSVISASAAPGTRTHQNYAYDKQIRNETLGFQKVFVISLPERGDRLDAFALSSSLTGFKADVAHGVNGSTVPDAAIPSTDGLHKVNTYGMKDPHARDAVVGTWRAHLNIARTIVQERLSSALIIEDDSDWDVTLKDRLVDFGNGARHFSKHATGEKPKNPYGDNWDMLWLGHCAITECPAVDPHSSTDPNNPHPPEPTQLTQQRFLIENDATTPPPAHRFNFATIPDLSPYADTTRAVFRADFGICLYSYALSYSGAQKVLRQQAVRTKWAPIDLGMGEMCKDQAQPFNCIGVFPQLVDSHKMAGAYARDSNIDQNPKDDVREMAYTFNLKYSTRLNVDRLLRGEAPITQWPDDPEIVAAPGGTKYRVEDVQAGQTANVMPQGAVFANGEGQKTDGQPTQ
ncbi:uncharacterized protein KY384_002973 [Bacidia gigantensis]|uniref:uncharacterized protein n=1 Tax=Bacidia gigantensis TaxID=2732470 RepID=UPI001D03D9FD|nr:uncharacterized protein KY384_002973 [Bacidia gigantensis]KAG8531344.1 hypothetical protein KY384_002973 [Bacidia gigantensis]